jgi:hypothetical protein
MRSSSGIACCRVGTKCPLLYRCAAYCNKSEDAGVLTMYTVRAWNTIGSWIVLPGRGGVFRLRSPWKFYSPVWLTWVHCSHYSGHSNITHHQDNGVTQRSFCSMIYVKVSFLKTMTVLMLPDKLCVYTVCGHVLLCGIWGCHDGMNLATYPVVTPCHLADNSKAERDFLLHSLGYIFSGLKVEAMCCSKPSSK